MAFLINRKAPSRIECLHSLLKFLCKNFKNRQFTLEDCMFSREEDNIQNYCSLIEETDFGLKCPYKESPLSDAGCYITNGKHEDTTKKKEVGNTINALHGMGFLHRDNHDVSITPLGVQFAEIDLNSLESYQLVKKAILSYGPVVGVLDEIESISSNGIFKAKDIAVGYPNTEETVFENGTYITISSGSTTDANTRSRSCYLSWLVTAGIIEPQSVVTKSTSQIPYIKYRDFLNANTLKAMTYKIIEEPSRVYSFIGKTEHPLDYSNLTKLTRALRENGQEEVRVTTMKYEDRIKNRRFAIMYLLNKAYENKTFLDFDKLYNFLNDNKDNFVISNDDFREVLKEELHIANVGGIPFNLIIENDTIKLFPKVGINVTELCSGAPTLIIDLLKQY